jgi:hypothetical protein
MNITTRLRLVRSVSVLAIVAAPVCALFFGLVPTEGANPASAVVQTLSSAVVGADPILDKIDPAAVAGVMSCTKCHKSEIAALNKSKHHSSDKLIQSGANIAKYAKAVGIKTADVLNNSLCVRCHATPQDTGAGVHSLGSVSCESCHGGASGKPDAWLKLHATENITDKQQAECDQAGMIRSSNIYAISKNCFQCHVVANEDLVNAGHPASNKIELVGWSSGEVRHNFQVDQKVNAEAPSLWLKNNKGASAENRRRVKFVVGVLVDLEVTLNNAQHAKAGRSDFVKGCAKRLKNSIGLLEDISDDLGGGTSADILALQEALKKLGKVTSSKIANIDAAKEAYPLAKAAAQSFETKFDGSELKALDKLIKKEGKPKGTPYSP